MSTEPDLHAIGIDESVAETRERQRDEMFL